MCIYGIHCIPSTVYPVYPIPGLWRCTRSEQYSNKTASSIDIGAIDGIENTYRDYRRAYIIYRACRGVWKGIEGYRGV